MLHLNVHWKDIYSFVVQNNTIIQDFDTQVRNIVFFILLRKNRNEMENTVYLESFSSQEEYKINFPSHSSFFQNEGIFIQLD